MVKNEKTQILGKASIHLPRRTTTTTTTATATATATTTATHEYYNTINMNETNSTDLNENLLNPNDSINVHDDEILINQLDIDMEEANETNDTSRSSTSTSTRSRGSTTNSRGRNFISRLGRFGGFSWRRRVSKNESDIFTESINSDGIDDSDESSGHNNAIVDSESTERRANDMNNDIRNNINNRARSGGSGEEEEGEGEDGQVPFVNFFFKSKGPPQIVLLSMLFALSLGSTIGVVPAVLTEKYAVLHHGFDGECSNFDGSDKPQECIDGSADAQAAAAAASFVSNVATFLTSSLIGAISDEYGRKTVMILAQFLACLSPTILVLLQLFKNMDPAWYYTANAMTGFISWISIALSSLSDVMPKQWRAPMFGLLLSGFSLGFALSPIFAIFCTRLGVSLLSTIILFLSFLYGLFCFPETLPPERAREARLQRTEYRMRENELKINCISRSLVRPFKELMILNRNNLFRLLSVLAFFSGMSTSADQTLLVYYVEDRLGFDDKDIAILFGLIGIVGIFVQGVMLKFFTDWVGERFVVVIAFACGAITNTIYAFANSKEFIFLAVIVGSFPGMSFPTISAIKANNAQESEQGRIQGALYALSSLASAVGPATLRLAYQRTKDTKHPGSFFLVASGFYVVAVACAYALPEDKANATRRRNDDYDEVALVESLNAPVDS